MNKYELIDKMISEHIRGSGREPNLITMHYNTAKFMINNVVFMRDLQVPSDSCTDLKYRGIRVIRSWDIEADEILVSRTNTN